LFSYIFGMRSSFVLSLRVGFSSPFFPSVFFFRFSIKP
jgi:hypothetical protein